MSHLEPVGKVCRVVWLGESPYQADQLVQEPPTEAQKEEKEAVKTMLEITREVLQTLLANGPRLIPQCKNEVARANVTSRTLERAAKVRGVVMSHAVEEGPTRYYWELP